MSDKGLATDRILDMNDRPTDAHQDPYRSEELCSVSHHEGRTVITVRSETASLRSLRKLVDEQLAPLVEAGRRAEYLVAVNEAATNAIQAHHRNGVPDPVTVTIDPLVNRVVVDDRGSSGGASPQADLVAAAARGEIHLDGAFPPASAHRGRGLRIIRTICPDVVVRQTADGIAIELPWD